MAKIQALILAAGRGSRLGAAGEDAPKSLLQVGRRHLIEHQLDALAESGVGPVHVVVGYGADEVRDLCGRGRAGLQQRDQEQERRSSGMPGRQVRPRAAGRTPAGAARRDARANSIGPV